MSCFSLGWFEQLLIWIVIVCAVVAILKIFIPWLFSLMGADTGPLLPILSIVMWAIIAIFAIYIVFALISCLLGAGGHLSLLPPK